MGSPTIRGGLVRSFWDGAFATVMVALSETFGIAAAVSLDAPSMAIALLGSIPLLLGSLGQYFLPAVIDTRRARKTQVLLGVGLQAFFLFACAFAGFLRRPYAAWAYVASIALAGVSANVTTASWVSWMGDLVPLEIRGRHFAWRSRLFACVNLSCAMIAGLSAANYSTRNAPWAFFTVIFVCAAFFRALSYQMLKRQYEPPVPMTGARPSFRVAPTPDFSFFSLAHALMQGAAAMSAPFFGVFYLRDLHFSFLALAVTSCCTVGGSIISLPAWGKLADRIGNRSTLRISGLMVGLMPLPYLFLTTRGAIYALNLVGGIAWAGYNLVSFNHLLSASENKDRTRLFAYASAVTGVVVFVMTLLGGVLSAHLPAWFAYPLQSLFLVSCAVRMCTFSWFFPRLHEYRPVTDLSASELFNQFPGYRTGLGLLRNFFRAFRG